MPYTTVLYLQSLAFPNISNPITVYVSEQETPTVIITSQTDTTPGHPKRRWTFAGLPRKNYLVEMWEVESGGNKLNRLADFDVVPDALMTVEIHDDFQAIVGGTPGVNVGATEIWFDGRTVTTPTNTSTFHEWSYNQSDANTFLESFTGVPDLGDKCDIALTLNGIVHNLSCSYGGGDGEQYANDIADTLATIPGWTTVPWVSLGSSGGNTLYTITAGGSSNTSCDFTLTHGGQSVKTEDFRGWNINYERRNMGGTMLKKTEYTWDKDLGYFSLLTPGDKLLAGEFMNLDFDPRSVAAEGGSTPPDQMVIDFSIQNKLVTANYTISKDDFGMNLIVEPAGTYMELTLPDPLTVKEGLAISISVFKTSICCVKIKGTIKFPYGASMFLINGESVSIYVFVRSTGVNEYRYKNDKANFDKVGQIVSYDQVQTSIIHAIRVGTLASILQHARLWQYVQQLPANQRVSYATWNNNNTFFSDASGNNFYVPERSGLYPRVASIYEVAGTGLAQQMMKHKHIGALGTGSSGQNPFGRTGIYGKQSFKDVDTDNDYLFTNDGTEIAGAQQLNPFGLIGTENRPNSYLTNQYFLL